MKSLLITGSTGFVGQHILQYLKNQFKLEELSIRYKPNQIFEVNSDVIIHLSGKAHDLKNVSNPSEYYESNFELTRQLYDAFLSSKAKKFIYISSVKAAADVVDDVLMENSSPHPQTHYGKSKLMAEQYIESQILPEDKFYYILRPCMIHGPGNKGNLNLLYRLVDRGIPYPLAAFKNKRSFLSVENLCFVIKNLVDKNVPSGIYNIADDDALSTNEVVSILAVSLSKKTKLWYIPERIIRFFAKIGDKINLPLNTERLNKLTEDYVVSNDKIKSVLESKLPITAQAGLNATANSFKE